jgi:hypothetical protein
MKKYKLLMIATVLVLAVLACNLPTVTRESQTNQVIEPNDGLRLETLSKDGFVIGLIVPESYVVEEAVPDLTTMVEETDIINLPGPVDLQGLVQASQEDILAWGYDTDSPGVISTSFVVYKNEEFAMMPLGIISTFAGNLLGEHVNIMEQSRLTISGRDTLRWITVTDQAGISAAQVVYLFKETGTLYIIGFNADSQGVAGQLDVYDAIVASLTISDLE